MHTRIQFYKFPRVAMNLLYVVIQEITHLRGNLLTRRLIIFYY